MSGTGKPKGATGGPAKLDLYLYQGDDWRRSIEIEGDDGEPFADLTDAEVNMQVRANFADVSSVLFECSVGDGITITDGPGAAIELLVAGEKTVLLTGSKPYLYDLEVVTAGGDRTTVLRGQVYFDLEITRVAP